MRIWSIHVAGDSWNFIQRIKGPSCDLLLRIVGCCGTLHTLRQTLEVNGIETGAHLHGEHWNHPSCL